VVDDKKLIRVKPTLTEKILQELVEKTRKIIVDLYVTCEDDFEKGVKLYEAIVEQQILLTTESQIKELDKVAQDAVSAYKKPTQVSSVVEKPVETQMQVQQLTLEGNPGSLSNPPENFILA
jgi:intergrase/recombinase